MDITSEINKIIGSPKSSTLEYNAVLPPSKTMAQLMSSFANTEGGYIVLGVSDNLEINGLSEDFHANEITKKAIALLTPSPTIVSQYISFKGKKLYVIGVEKSEMPIRLEGKKYIRVNTKTTLSNPTELKFNANGYIYEIKEKTIKVEEPDNSISYHAYDVNLSQSYLELEKQLENVTQSRTGITKGEYLSRMKSGIDSYCKYYGLGSLDTGMPVILKYPAYNYHAHLAFQLMTFDINKISAMLDFQHENYVGLDPFQKIVEHGVYDWIKQNSPFDNAVRLQKIMEWVEKKQKVEHKKNKIANTVGDKILEGFKTVNADVGHILMLGSVQIIYNSLTPPEKKEFNNVFNGMVSDSFIGFDSGEPNFIKLGDKGYEKIYNEEGETQKLENVNENKDLPVVVILTAIKEEYAAVRAHLDPDKITVLKRDSVLYEEGIFKHNGLEIAKVIIKECGPKNPGTAQETQRAITNFRPQCIFFVGIAGSRKPNDFGIGDVIFPVNVHYYEGGKSELDSFKPRSDDVKPTFSLCEIARIERHKPDWKGLIKGNIEHDVSADLGVIASGEQVVEHYDSEIGKILTKHYGDTACIAMEEYGFLNSVQRQGVEFATMIAGVVRGVSDILEGSNNEHTPENDSDRRPASARKLASNTAAAFAYWLIVKVFQDSTK